MASSLPKVYAYLKFSGKTSSQFHGYSSCPDVSAFSNYIEDYSSFNTSYTPDSIFLPEFLGISDVSMPEYNNYYKTMGVNNAKRYFNAGDQEYFRFSSDIKPLLRSFTGEQSWGNSDRGIQAEPNTKVGCYSVEERKDKIMRYLKKKKQRNFNKTIKYVCRKTLVERRVRVRGRFARNNDTCEQQSPMSKNHNNLSASIIQ